VSNTNLHSDKKLFYLCEAKDDGKSLYSTPIFCLCQPARTDEGGEGGGEGGMEISLFPSDVLVFPLKVPEEERNSSVAKNKKKEFGCFVRATAAAAASGVVRRVISLQ
jgi:hypothetical protein